VYDRDSILSVSANQFTISQAGTYEISWEAPAYSVGNNKALLYSITDSAIIAYGSSILTATGAMNVSRGTSVVTIASAKTFSIQHYGQTTVNTNGFGVAVSLGTEVYTSVVIRQG
jgi:hypothetical protein